MSKEEGKGTLIEIDDATNKGGLEDINSGSLKENEIGEGQEIEKN